MKLTEPGGPPWPAPGSDTWRVSPTNLELVREGFDAFQTSGSEGAIESIERRGRLHPEFLTVVDEGPNTGIYEGMDGYRKATGEWFEVWASFEIEVRDVIELDRDRIMIVAHQRATAKGTGIEIEAPFHYVFFFEGDRLRQFHLYNDRSRAEAGELVEQ
jgi:hypothetical protein